MAISPTSLATSSYSPLASNSGSSTAAATSPSGTSAGQSNGVNITIINPETNVGTNGVASTTAGGQNGATAATSPVSGNSPQGTPQEHLMGVYQDLTKAYEQASTAQDAYLRKRDEYGQLSGQLNDMAYAQYANQYPAGQPSAPLNTVPQGPITLPGYDTSTQQQAIAINDPYQQQAQSAAQLPPSAPWGTPAGTTIPQSGPQALLGQPAPSGPSPFELAQQAAQQPVQQAPGPAGGFSPQQLQAMAADPAIQAQAQQLAQQLGPQQLQALAADPQISALAQQLMAGGATAQGPSPFTLPQQTPA